MKSFDFISFLYCDMPSSGGLFHYMEISLIKIDKRKEDWKRQKFLKNFLQNIKRLCYNKNMHRTEGINCQEDSVMIQKEKVKLMTKMAIFEKKEHRKTMEIMRYRRQDYVALHVILSWICAVILVGAVVALMALYIISKGSQILFQPSYLKMTAIIGLVLFIMFSFIYCFLTYWHYVEQYENAEKKFKEYEKMLNQLNQLYEE